jgi:hypothetical protein
MGSRPDPGDPRGSGYGPGLGAPALRTMVESSRVSRVSEGEMYRRFHSVAGT